MTILPLRINIAEIGNTQGAVRAGLGDMRDFLAEALGTSGTSPVLTNAQIKGATSVGVGAGMTSPGTTMQVAGGFAITSNTSPALDPGAGSGYIYNNLQFSSTLQQKLLLHPTNKAEMGVQTNTVYVRTNNNFAIYKNGDYSSTAIDAGVGGSTLARISDSGFKYLGQDVYTVAVHGALAAKGTDNAFSALQTFSAGARFTNQPLRIGSEANQILFEASTTGRKLSFYGGGEQYSLGIQPSTVFMRTGGAFTVYLNGTFSDAYNTPGTGGVTLFHVANDTIMYKSARIHHDGINGHGGNIDADTLDGFHGAAYVRKANEGNRPGVLQMFIEREDTPHAMYFYRDPQNRFRWQGHNTQTFSGFETAVNWADAANTANSAGNAATANNAAATGNIATCAFGDQTRKNTIEFLAHTLSNDGIGVTVHNDGGFMRLLTSNGAPTRVSRADNANNADTATNLTGGIGINNLHKGQAQAIMKAIPLDWAGNTVSHFGVHQYTFASPNIVFNDNATRHMFVAPVRHPSGNTSSDYRAWSAFTTITSGSTGAVNTVHVIWDYLTASGDPQLWVIPDDNGNIVQVWDSEDPLDDLFPDTVPIVLAEGNTAKRVKMPTINYIQPLLRKLMKDTKMPSWFFRSKWKDLTDMNPEDLFMLLVAREAELRSWGMDSHPDLFKSVNSLNEFILDFPGLPDSKKDWRVQLIMRQLSRVVNNHSDNGLAALITKNFKMPDKNKPLLALK
jgi:hypothetical protein